MPCELGIIEKKKKKKKKIMADVCIFNTSCINLVLRLYFNNDYILTMLKLLTMFKHNVYVEKKTLTDINNKKKLQTKD